MLVYCFILTTNTRARTKIKRKTGKAKYSTVPLLDECSHTHTPLHTDMHTNIGHIDTSLKLASSLVLA